MSKRASLVLPRSGRSMADVPVDKPIRLGVVGLGPRGRGNVCRSAMLYDEYKLAAICDIRSDVLKFVSSEIEQEHGIKVPGYLDYEEMFRKQELDAVAVIVNPDSQIPIACRAMESGCHVMVEVPTAYSMDDCWRAVVTKEKTGKTFMLMEQLRFSGYIRAWRRIVETGVIGKPLFVEGEYFGHKPDAFFQDREGRYYTADQAKGVPGAKPTWRHMTPTIGYLPHEMSPMLYVIDDRVSRVVAMSTRKRSYKYPDIEKADLQVALMHTEKDVVMRMAVGHTTPCMPRQGGSQNSSHWHHVKGSEGILEWGRGPDDKPRLWVDGWQLSQPIEVGWGNAQADAPKEAKESSHGGRDYYVFAQFADAVLHDVPPELDVYKSVETAAPSVLAAKSIEEENRPFDVPDFRPGDHRKAGEWPRDFAG